MSEKEIRGERRSRLQGRGLHPGHGEGGDVSGEAGALRVGLLQEAVGLDLCCVCESHVPDAPVIAHAAIGDTLVGAGREHPCESHVCPPNVLVGCAPTS